MVEPELGWHLFPAAAPHLRSDLRMDALLWGAAVAFALDDARAREKLRAEVGFGVWMGILAAALLAIGFYSNLSSVWLAVLIPTILAGTVLHPEWRVSRMLEVPVLAWIGRISYSLYIWQQLFLVPGWDHPSHWWTRWPWNLAAVPGVGCGSYYLVEKPLLRVGRRLAARLCQDRISEEPRVQPGWRGSYADPLVSHVDAGGAPGRSGRASRRSGANSKTKQS
jgi:peptidoglycan/LPS O-acetylase OafA/YrhL